MLIDFALAHWRILFAAIVFALALAWGEYWHLRDESAQAQLTAIIAQDAALTAKANAENTAEKLRQSQELSTQEVQYAGDLKATNDYYSSIIDGLRRNAPNHRILPKAYTHTKSAKPVQCYDKAALGKGLDSDFQQFEIATIKILQQGDDSIATLGFCEAFVNQVERK